MNECKLVDVEKFQKVPTSECKALGQVPYLDIISHNESVKGYKMKCDVNQKTICQIKICWCFGADYQFIFLMIPGVNKKPIRFKTV